MDSLATAVYLDLGVSIKGGIDLLSISDSERSSTQSYLDALGGDTKVQRHTAMALFRGGEDSKIKFEDQATQAWAAQRAVSSIDRATLMATPRVDVQVLLPEYANALAETVRHMDRGVALTPTRVKNEVDSEVEMVKGELKVRSNHFKNRLRYSSAQHLEIRSSSSNKAHLGTVKRHSGRTAMVDVSVKLAEMPISEVTTVGRPDPTFAQALRTDVALKALQGTVTLQQSPFFQGLCSIGVWDWGAIRPPFKSRLPLRFTARRLNASQHKTVKAILSNDNDKRIVVCHGPPGTGKTTVIAAAVTSIMAASSSYSVWLVAQSNVAVKNIAEKLASVGFDGFTILVSKDFHFDWHEHLYTELEKYVIRSDRFDTDAAGAERQLEGRKVVLCTLSMLSNPNISAYNILAPPETIIVDEASQIEIGDYLPLLHTCGPTLKKMVLIGDNNQLPPYAQNDIPDLKSIFEMHHLRSKAYFLDTQYRMPVVIGNFISKAVYNGKLKSIHSIKSSGCCRFVDVSNGIEAKKGYSWINKREAQVVEQLAAILHDKGKSYRVITPYDAQRGLLERAMKVAKLPWEDKCFNVDSFQGNEDDYIVVSLVRTKKIGFLRDQRRMNVMLTRCKKGMIIVTNRPFMVGEAVNTLAGGLVQKLGANAWIESSISILKDIIGSFLVQ